MRSAEKIVLKPGVTIANGAPFTAQIENMGVNSMAQPNRVRQSQNTSLALEPKAILNENGEFVWEEDIILTMTVHPNPANGPITVDVGQRSGTLQLLDATGTVYFEGAIAGQLTLETSQLPSGMYLVKVDSKGQSETKRISVVH